MRQAGSVGGFSVAPVASSPQPSDMRPDGLPLDVGGVRMGEQSGGEHGHQIPPGVPGPHHAEHQHEVVIPALTWQEG